MIYNQIWLKFLCGWSPISPHLKIEKQKRQTDQGEALFIVRIFAPWRQKNLEIFGFLRKFEKQWRLSSCQQPRNRRQVSSHDRARECVARTPANRRNFLICCCCGCCPLRRTHAFCNNSVLSLSPRLCPRTPFISPRQTRHTTSILSPLLLLSSLRMHIGLDVCTKKMKILPPISSNMSFTQIYSNQGLFFSIF